MTWNRMHDRLDTWLSGGLQAALKAEGQLLFSFVVAVLKPIGTLTGFLLLAMLAVVLLLGAFGTAGFLLSHPPYVIIALTAAILYATVNR